MRYNHYEFLFKPFSLMNALIAFMDLMNRVFRPYQDLFVILFVDDILIYLRLWEEHETHLQIALQALQKHRLYAKLSKSKF